VKRAGGLLTSFTDAGVLKRQHEKSLKQLETINQLLSESKREP
jgi:hypothetical protein